MIKLIEQKVVRRRQSFKSFARTSRAKTKQLDESQWQVKFSSAAPNL